MTVMATPLTGAPSAIELTWDTINWQKVRAHVRQLQMRIAKAYREGRRSKARALQRILTRSFYAKLLAVKRVVQNSGAKTPGVDKVVWSTSKPTQGRTANRKGCQRLCGFGMSEKAKAVL